MMSLMDSHPSEKARMPHDSKEAGLEIADEGALPARLACTKTNVPGQSSVMFQAPWCSVQVCGSLGFEQPCAERTQL